MKKRVLLINPPYPLEESPAPPFGLMSLGAYLLENDIEVIIEDYIVNPYTRERAREIVNRFRPDVIGATAVTMNVNNALRILKDYSEESPDSIILMGGPHATFDAESLLADNGHVDFIVRGEGEITATELMRNLGDTNAYKDIKGLSYRDNGSIVHNETRDFIPDINILPYPARNLIQLSKYKALGLPINMITSRGCPFECIFCVGSKMVGRRVRYFDIERVVDEFEMLAAMGFRQINIVDDLFTSHKKRCVEICEKIIRRGIKHEWTAFARVDTVSRDLLDIMKASGCNMLCFGIESGVQEILDRVKKKTTLEKIEKALALCKEAGIVPMASYIMGLPGETPETVKQTMDFAKSTCNSYGFHILAPFPGTEVREKAEEYGMRILTSDWDKYDANQSVCESIYLPHHEVDRIVNEFNGGINRLIIGILKKHERGEDVSPSDLDMVHGIMSLDFSYKLISGKMVETYSANSANGAGMNGFIDYVIEHSEFERDTVIRELDRLFTIGCLIDRSTPDATCISWA